MNKYLFTDGNGVKEVQSQEELQTLIAAAAKPELIRVWAFNTNEWMSYSRFTNNDKQREPVKKINGTAKPIEATTTKKSVNGFRGLKRFMFFIVAATVIFLIYNFTKVSWEKVASLNITAGPPANVPYINMDSVFQNIEASRGIAIDKVTKTNLRIRNTWPDRITLQLAADHDISNVGSKYYNLQLSIDNSTGYNIDKAVAKLTVWKNNKVSSSDTFHFNNISYALAPKRMIENNYRGDSISISFQSIKAKAFNFCYSDDKKSNYGNANDRWFCRE